MKEKMHKGRDRYYFRESMRGIVSEEVLNRTDKGDLSPVFRNEFNNLSNQKIINLIMGKKKSQLNKIIDKGKLTIFLNKYRKNPLQQNANILYKLVYLSQWLKKNFN
jgi:asparagine synthetase B (glutamine-hydrolysing)